MYAVILAGGGGTRLWPLSRRGRPKPYLPLLGEESLFQQTVARLGPLIEPADAYVVTEARHLALAAEQAPSLSSSHLIGEPVGRNTAAAIALAALVIERPGDGVMALLPADHRISDEAAFRDALAAACEAAADGALVTLGITPSRPETAYGYVLAATGEAGPVQRVERFVEKPTLDRAQELLAGGRAYWNAGIFVWRRDALLDRLQRHAGHIIAPLRDGLDAGRTLDEFYPDVPSISIDYAVLEPASLEGAIKVVPSDFGWSDVGSWSALRAELEAKQPRSESGAVSVGRNIDLDSDDVFVHSSGDRLVVTIGLRGTIVVDTPDVVLVCDADRAQDVRRIVDSLVEAKETEHL